MIIHSISAENVLKYARLTLDDLPAQGVIAVSGPNESGKSSIGEAICFALFGRTFSLGPDQIQKLIRWGEIQCSVSLVFSARDDKRYQINRFLDIDGNHGVRLQVAGDEANPIARGVAAVAEVLMQLIGFEFDEFVESFYLAQREITTPHPHSQAVKIMAGVAPLEFVAQTFVQEITETRLELQARQQGTLRVEQELKELGIREGELQELEQQRQQLLGNVEEEQAMEQGLDAASDRYQNSVPRFEAASRSRARSSALRFLSLVLALLVGGVWYVLARMPDSEIAQTLRSLLLEQIPQWSADYRIWLLYAAGGFAVLFAVFWIRRVSLGSRINELRETSNELASRLDGLSAEDQDQPDVSAAGKLQQRIAELAADAEEVRDGVGHEVSRQQELIGQHREEVEGLGQAIDREDGRLATAANLCEERDVYREQIEKAQRRIYLRELAGELLQGACRRVSVRFNRDLRDLVGRTLPLFTEDRYQHLQIDTDLTVQVFSSEKRGFMVLEEISSGTQRQIMLAIRLALSQQLIKSTVKGKQFVILDEPFAFFDRERARSSLSVLPKLSENITQVWIIAQEFPAETSFDRHIVCAREHLSLPPESS
jgi:exonuclease SbcC